jgi:hypothetical protein
MEVKMAKAGRHISKETRLSAISARIDRDLESLAREIIPRSPTASPAFLDRPDAVDEHKPRWHQFGIIEHTRRLVAALDDEVPRAIEAVDRQIAQRVERHFEREISDDRSDDETPGTRCELLRVAGYFHDLGKFATRTMNRRGEYRFIGHADVSARLVLGESGVVGLGTRYGLWAAEIRHVARLCALHYAPMELRLQTAQSGKAATNVVYESMAGRFGQDGYDICAIFLADTIAKGSTPSQDRDQHLLTEVFESTLRAVDSWMLRDGA